MELGRRAAPASTDRPPPGGGPGMTGRGMRRDRGPAPRPAVEPGRSPAVVRGPGQAWQMNYSKLLNKVIVINYKSGNLILRLIIWNLPLSPGIQRPGGTSH